MGIINAIPIGGTGSGEWHEAVPSAVTSKKLTFSIPYMPSEWFVFYTWSNDLGISGTHATHAGAVGGEYYVWTAAKTSSGTIYYSAAALTTEYADGAFTITSQSGVFLSQTSAYTLIYV